jgi:hypothetical protein
MSSDELPELRALRQAAEGLEYPSESDAPFEPFQWEAKGDGSAASQVAAHARPGQKIEEVPVDRFFAQLDDSDDAERFRQLRRVLESQLPGVKIFRAGVGETEVDIYLLGQTRAGNWAGLHTVSVET